MAGEELAATHVALGRVVLGAATLHLLVLAFGHRLPRGRAVWGQLAILAVFWNSVPFVCFAWGEQRASSVLAGIWNGTTPLWTLLLLAVALREERPTRDQVLGLGLGFVGVVTVLAPWEGLGGSSVAGQAAFFLAAVCYAIGLIFTRRFLTGRADSGLALSAGQLTCAAVQLALVASLAGAPDPGLSGEAIGSMIALGVLGTGLVYAMFFAVVREAGAATASSVGYLIVLFSAALGIVVLGESVGWHEPAGAALIVVALGISQGHARLLGRLAGSLRARSARRASRAAGR
ncbi:MAG: DMT family transporter [Actinomycetota bacterium]|nr:DMT family transporter [Actinomycetota bacterium]